MPANAEPDYVGLDIAKDQLDYCIDEHTEGRCPNTAEGRAQLITQLRGLPHARVILEASGGYEKVVVAELLQAGVEVCVVQPGRVRAMAHAEGLAAKTDRIDARLLGRYGQRYKLRLAVPIDPAAALLRELIEHRRALTTQQTEVQGRLDVAGPTLRQLLETQNAFLTAQLAAVEKLIAEQIERDPDMRHKARRMQEVKGVGPVLAATILAYVPELGQLDSAKLSSLLGVAPHPKDSANTRSPRHVRGGRGQVRSVLYMAAVCASRWNPILAAFYQRLRSRGKPATVALVAVMRKLVCLLNHLIQNPNFVLVR
jgi:transposase